MAYAALPNHPNEVEEGKSAERSALLERPQLVTLSMPAARGRIELKRPVVDGQWSTDFCGCCDPPGGFRLCLFSTMMPAWTVGLIVEQMDPERVICGGNFWGGCCLAHWLAYATAVAAAFVGPLLPLVTPLYFHLHRSVQKKYGIKSNVVWDCLAAWLCPCLLVCQDAREMMIRENAPLMSPLGPAWPGAGGNPALAPPPAYN